MTEMTTGTDRIDIGRTVSAALGFAVTLLWLSLGPRDFLGLDRHFSSTVFLFALGSSCLVISKTDLASWKSLSGRTVYVAPAVLSLSLLLPWLSTPLKSAIVGAAAFTSAILICQWLSLFTTLTSYEFSLSYAFASVTVIAVEGLLFSRPMDGTLRAVVYSFPFLAASLLLLIRRRTPSREETEERGVQVGLFTPKTMLYLFFFSFVLNGAEILSSSFLNRLPSMTLLKGGAYSFSLVTAAAAFRLYGDGDVTPRHLKGGSLFFCAVGTLILGLSVATGVFFLEAGCALFELSFWLLILRVASADRAPWRAAAGGAALITFALLSSSFLSDRIFSTIPFLLAERAYYFQTGLFFALSTLFLFLPLPSPSIEAVKGGAPAAGAAPLEQDEKGASDSEQSSPELDAAERELLLKGIFESFGLTRQESRVALLLLDGAGDEELCNTLFISKNTLKYHIRNLIRKLDISGRKELPGLVERALAKTRWKGETES